MPDTPLCGDSLHRHLGPCSVYATERSSPESPTTTFTGEGRILRFVCHDIRRLSPAGLRWLYDWMGDTFDLQERP